MTADFSIKEVNHFFNKKRNDLLTESNDYFFLSKKVDYIEKIFCESKKVEKTELERKKDKPLLLVFNMQNDFIYGCLRSNTVEKVLSPIKNVVSEAWRRNIPIVHVCDSHFQGMDPDFEIWGDHAIEGSTGAEIISSLLNIPFEYIIKKQGYSAFYDTKLDEILRFWNIKHIYMCGVYTEAAILQSTLDAFNRGYKVWLIEDCITGHKKRGHENAMENMASYCHAGIIDSIRVSQEFQKI
ncbi:MAG: isochorismatase family cysteine hydrolase [Lachnospiraceae bacterium]|nr:isochorismatase family cysteine hydrolase [Lachnospiraceae bacterium]